MGVCHELGKGKTGKVEARDYVKNSFVISRTDNSRNHTITLLC